MVLDNDTRTDEAEDGSHVFFFCFFFDNIVVTVIAELVVYGKYFGYYRENCVCSRVRGL